MEKDFEFSSKSSDSGIVIMESIIELDNNSFGKMGEKRKNLKTLYCPKSELEQKNETEDFENYAKTWTNDDSSSIASSFKSNSSDKIYINSIKLNDEHSLAYNSDSDQDFDSNNCIIKKLGKPDNTNESVMNNLEVIKQDIGEVMSNNPTIDGAPTKLTDVARNLNINNLSIGGNTSDVTVGNKYIFDGNVVIKQFVVEKSASINKTNNTTANDNFICKNHTHIDQNKKMDPSILEHSTGNNNLTLPKTKIDKWWFHKNFVILGGMVILLGTILAVVGWKLDKKNINNRSTEFYYQVGDGDDSRKNIPIDSTIGDDIIRPGQFLRIVSRSEWIAQPPNVELVNLTVPVNRVIIAHTATEPCETQAKCTFRVRYIQTFHIESRGFDDIGYNFLVGGDGSIYEGRGWDKVGAHTKGYNFDSICIAFIGTFNNLIPPKGQIHAAKLIIQEGLRLEKLSKNFKLYGHRQLIPTESPGVELFKLLQKWPHFATELNSINPIKENETLKPTLETIIKTKS